MKNIIYAVASGLLLVLAWPTYGFPLLLLFAFVPLLYAEFRIRNFSTSHKKLKVLGLAYISFFIWNLFTTYWIYFSTPFGGAFAVLVNSLLMSLVFLLYHVVAKRTGFSAASAFLISIWIVFEKLHLSWDFSWPWLNLGNGFSEYINWVQWYEYTGIFGGTLWVWIVNIAAFKMLLQYREFRKKSILIRSSLKLALLIFVPILVSYLILFNYKMPSEKMEVVILQPNINPYTEKYNTTDKRIGELLVSLAKEKVTDSTSLLLVPETVFADGTRLPEVEFSEAAYVGRALNYEFKDLNFLGGISLFERFNNPEKVRAQTNEIGKLDWYDDYNSAFFITPNEKIELYHKSKLVVGVENFPYQNILKPIFGNIMIDLGGTVAMKTTQPDREVFELNNGTFTAPIICYESIYGDYVTGYVKNGANFLSIITNDAWWGDSPGHKQHMSYARLRAVETRRSVARSANTGISAIINPTGKVIQKLGYEKKGSLKGNIILNSKKTFYVQHGDYIARIAQFLALFLFLFAVVKFKRNIKR